MKHSKGEYVFQVFNIVFMIVLSIVMIYPFLNQLAVSLNEGADASFGGITIYPRKFTLSNYITIFSNRDIQTAVYITVSRVVLATLLGLVVTIFAAYALTKKDLPGRNFVIWFLILPMYISAGMIPTYILYRYLNLVNNYLVYIIPGAFSFYNMIVIKTYLDGLPKGLEESAIIDGANEVQVLFLIIIPLSMPVIATVCLWIAVGHWNDWVTTLIYITKSKLYTLQYVMMEVVKESEVVQQIATQSAMSSGVTRQQTPTPDTIKAATVMVSTLPIVMLYPFLQKYFVKGVVIGAVKG